MKFYACILKNSSFTTATPLCSIKKKKYEQAAFQFRLLIDKLPCNAFLFLSLGAVLEDMNAINCAKHAYETAYSLDANPKTARSYGRILSKLGFCCEARQVREEIEGKEEGFLTQALAEAEGDLYCKRSANAACLYRGVLEEYPYNQEALFGLLKSSTFTRNSQDALLSYRRWPWIGFDVPVQNMLMNYYRPPECILPFEYFDDSSSFHRTSLGLDYNFYLLKEIRLGIRSYYSQFAKTHFKSIERESIALSGRFLFNESWECSASFIENYYDSLQHQAKPKRATKKNPAPPPPKHWLYSKAVANAHFHLTYHCLPEFLADVGYDYYDVIDTIPPFDNPIYNYSDQIGAIALNIRTADWKLFLSYEKERFYCFGSVTYGRYSEGNTKVTNSFRIGYRVCDIPSTSLYYSYFYLNFKNPAPLFYQNGYSESAYYDPKNLEIHSLGLTCKFDWNYCVQVGGEAATVYLPKCRNFGFSGAIYLDYRLTDRWSCRLDLRYYYQNQGVTRTGITGYYRAESANIQVNCQY